MSKINKKYSATIKGTLCIDENILSVEVENIENPVKLSDLFEDFDGKDICITIFYNQEF